jgi:GTP-binding protein
VAARGGRGGLGNIHFKTPIRQFPQFALLGEPGQKKELILELQMLADVALI